MTELGHYGVVDGSDYSGKSTLLRHARSFADEHGIETLFVREPGGTDYGAQIREIILHSERPTDAMTELLLFTADRSHLWHSAIEPALERGIHVIGDRSYLSTLVYQAIASQKLTIEQVLQITELAMPQRYMRPDSVAILSLSKKVWLQRKYGRLNVEAADLMESRDDEFFDRVRDGYNSLGSIIPNVTIIDADQEEKALFDHVQPLLFPDYDRAS
jgi:dTMP kinase